MAEPVNGRRQYRSGKRFEDRVAADLRANGYFAQRSPGSKGVADVVAVKPGQVLLVQCKTDGALPPKPWNALYDAAQGCGAVPVLADRTAPRSGLLYWRLERRKDGRGGRQPMTRLVIDEPGEVR